MYTCRNTLMVVYRVCSGPEYTPVQLGNHPSNKVGIELHRPNLHLLCLLKVNIPKDVHHTSRHEYWLLVFTDSAHQYSQRIAIRHSLYVGGKHVVRQKLHPCRAVNCMLTDQLPTQHVGESMTFALVVLWYSV